MSILFIANTTKQVMELQFTVPENKKVIVDRIRPGQQKRIWPPNGPGDTPGVESIIEQLSRYGLVEAKAVPRTKPFVGMCYSLNKEIDLEKLQLAFEHNDKVLIERGYEMRKAGVLATDQAMVARGDGYRGFIEQEIIEQQAPGMPEPKIERETLEFTRPGKKPRGRPESRAGG